MTEKGCAGAYRFGFNGKEKDHNGEWGTLTHYDYGFRIYNPAIGRWLSVDPLMKEYPWYTPYQFAGNSPIANIDLDGLEPQSAGKVGDVETAQDQQTGVDAEWEQYGGDIGWQVRQQEVTVPGATKLYRQVTSNTLVVTDLLGRNPEYSFIYPQNLGSWNEDGSDGLRWIGCLSCHADNGAYRYAAYNSQERLAGLLIAQVTSEILGGSIVMTRSTSLRGGSASEIPVRPSVDMEVSYNYWQKPRATGGGVLTPEQGYLNGQFMPGKPKMLQYGRGTPFNYLSVNGTALRPTGTNYSAFGSRTMKAIGYGGTSLVLLRAYIKNLEKAKK